MQQNPKKCPLDFWKKVAAIAPVGGGSQFWNRVAAVAPVDDNFWNRVVVIAPVGGDPLNSQSLGS